MKGNNLIRKAEGMNVQRKDTGEEPQLIIIFSIESSAIEKIGTAKFSCG